MLSYTMLAVTLAEANAYAASRAWSDWTGNDTDKTAALRRGQDYIAGYNGRWTVEFDDATAPDLVKFAIIEAARRELIEPGSLAPDFERGGRIKSMQAGSVSLTYADGAPAETSFSAIDGLLAGLLRAKSSTTVCFMSRA